MKMITKSVLAAGVTAFAVTSMLAAPHSGNNGTDILHFSVHKSFQDEGVEPGAGGNASASQNKQGNANNQKLDVSVNGLTADTTYSLFALTSDDTNNLTSIGDFTTDSSGNKILHYRSLGNGHGGGKSKIALPGNFSVSSIRELDVVNTNTVILSADFTSPSSLQYLVKRDISDNGVSASLRIKATTSQTQFKLFASGLVADTGYLLAINGSPAETDNSDSNGNLTITSFSGLDVLDIHAVALWDTSSNVVVHTTLP
jgi:hypothetical protein